MTRKGISHTLSALAAVLSLTFVGQASAGDRQQTPKLHPSQLQWAPAVQAQGVTPGSTSGLTTKRPSAAQGQWRWWQDYSGGK